MGRSDRSDYTTSLSSGFSGQSSHHSHHSNHSRSTSTTTSGMHAKSRKKLSTFDELGLKLFMVAAGHQGKSTLAIGDDRPHRWVKDQGSSSRSRRKSHDHHHSPSSFKNHQEPRQRSGNKGYDGTHHHPGPDFAKPGRRGPNDLPPPPPAPSRPQTFGGPGPQAGRGRPFDPRMDHGNQGFPEDVAYGQGTFRQSPGFQ